MPDPATVTFSLISHTNVGKTTLARTLLRRDVGDTLDRPHVTDLSEAHVMVASQGRRLLLWDTPGFGDTARLLKRLKSSEQPIRWMVTQMWDRYVNRPLWCSQQAVKNVRDEADLVLYLVDASQRPEDMPYVAMEMEILSWMGKPVVLLLNQTGPPRPAGEDKGDEGRWHEHLAKFSIVKGSLDLDAFARCWVQEGELLEAVSALIPVEKKEAYRLLREAWREKNLNVHREAVGVLARLLGNSLLDAVKVSGESLLQKIGLNRGEIDSEMGDARRQLSQRLSQRSVSSTDELIKLFGLEGHTNRRMNDLVKDQFGVPQKVSESLWSALGGLAGGLATGVVVDIMAHGMTFFGGSVVGALSGGIGGFALAKSYNLVRGRQNDVRWSFNHWFEQVQLALLCYLGVAHFGRGRGEWEDSEHPAHWRETVIAAALPERPRLEALWKEAGDAKSKLTPEEVETELRGVLSACCASVLRQLYPAIEVFA
jgi:Domain of unknown function (DUF3482)/50S ribosome-binding GTPase